MIAGPWMSTKELLMHLRDRWRLLAGRNSGHSDEAYSTHWVLNQMEFFQTTVLGGLSANRKPALPKQWWPISLTQICLKSISNPSATETESPHVVVNTGHNSNSYLIDVDMKVSMECQRGQNPVSTELHYQLWNSLIQLWSPIIRLWSSIKRW